MPPKPASDVDTYLASLPLAQRQALEALRAVIKQADPAATETFAYGMAGFKHRGRPLAYIGAAKSHCGLYGMSAENAAFAEELKGFSRSKGTIRFTPDKPLPSDVVTRMVQARISAIEKR